MMPTIEPGWENRRALVTGATGFIGSHLVQRLLELGCEVHVVSRRPAGPVPGVQWHIADLGEPDASAEVVRTVRPDAIFHLASVVTGSRDPQVVLPAMRANLMAPVGMLVAAAQAGLTDTRIVLAGSMEEPGPSEAPARPSSPYAAAKWAATGYARMCHALWGVKVAVLRVAMAYGPGQHDRTKLVPYVIRSFLDGSGPEIASGRRLMDWVYIQDVVDAFIAAASADAAAGAVLDIGSGVPVSVRDTVELLRELTGVTVLPRYGALADRPLESARVADLEPAASVLGWRPKVDLREGMRRTVSSYAEHR